MKKIVEKIYRWLKDRGLLRPDRMRRQMKQLNYRSTAQLEEAIDACYIRRIRMVCVVGLVTLLVSLIAVWMDCADEKGLVIERNGYGEETGQYDLVYKGEGGETEAFDVEVASVQYSPEEREQAFQESFSYLESNMLGDNPSMLEIREKLELKKTVPWEGITVSWSSDNYELIDSKGIVHNEEISDKQKVCLELKLQYEDYEECRSYELWVVPRLYTEEEQRLRSVQRAVEERLKENPYEQEVVIPDRVTGGQIQETGHRMPVCVILLIVGGSTCGLLWMRPKEVLGKQVKKRKQTLLREYPNLVNQLLLYIGAGTTIKGAFERMLRRYEQKGETTGCLYQELKYMWNDMKLGCSQEQAYINMGRRIGLLPYMKFTTLLVQQIQKGSGGITLLLEQEEHMAFEQRKQQARKNGEEVGTKLLFPMILLMIISMIIVAGPAVMNFNI